MTTYHFGGVPAPKKSPRDFFQLTGIAFPRAIAQNLLPFPIPNLLRDSLLGMYITPALAKIHPDERVQAVYHDVRAFLITLRDYIVLARRGDLKAHVRANRMLAFPEATELRYGYAEEGSMGNGLGGGKLHNRVFDTLMDVPELLDVAIDVPDVLALLPQISIDRMGDLIGSVAKEAIIAQTQHFMRVYFPSSPCIRAIDVPGVWDASTQRWVTRRGVLLPVADDSRAILLPHKHTVRSSPPLRAQQFAHFIGRFEMDKPSVIEYIAEHHGVLRKFADEVLKDEWRYRPRQMFRD